jgi:hypothetical protein
MVSGEQVRCDVLEHEVATKIACEKALTHYSPHIMYSHRRQPDRGSSALLPA